MILPGRLLASSAMDSSRFTTLAKNWEVFGRRDPLFGVLSDPTKQHGRWGQEEFFESGRAHVAKLFRVLDEHGVHVQGGRALDFGCGVGRLTRPIAERFTHTVGVDVAKSMVAIARQHNTLGARCEFVVNPHPDLRAFPSASVDFVHSCLVLQHIPPDVSPSYISEFLRILRPGGLAVFQAPAQVLTDAEIDARLALPQDGYQALIVAGEVPASIPAGARATVGLRLTNRSAVEWVLDIPGGRHLCVANHWLDEHGVVVVPDDGRTRLPHDLAAGQSCLVRLEVTAPASPGPYVLEVDLVQERICWFAQHGSQTARVPMVVTPAVVQRSAPVAEAPPPGPGWLSRLRQWWQGPAPFFEMHVVPREVVERTVANAGGRVLHAIEDGAAGAGWISYTYVCRKSPA